MPQTLKVSKGGRLVQIFWIEPLFDRVAEKRFHADALVERVPVALFVKRTSIAAGDVSPLSCW